MKRTATFFIKISALTVFSVMALATGLFGKSSTEPAQSSKGTLLSGLSPEHAHADAVFGGGVDQCGSGGDCGCGVGDSGSDDC